MHSQAAGDSLLAEEEAEVAVGNESSKTKKLRQTVVPRIRIFAYLRRCFAVPCFGPRVRGPHLIALCCVVQWLSCALVSGWMVH